jgi:hypothetical protein
MERTITAVFDGEVFRPSSPVDMQPNTSCVLTVVTQSPPAAKAKSVWQVLDEYTGKIDGPEDWSLEHDHYLYGTPKRYSKGPE